MLRSKKKKHRGHPWWKVKLPGTYAVQKVKVWNRTDCCSRRLKGFKVSVGRNTCGALKGASVQTVECKGAVGRHVKIHGKDDNLMICEVKIWGEKVQTSQRAF
jgi:hypothetical protein